MNDIDFENFEKEPKKSEGRKRVRRVAEKWTKEKCVELVEQVQLYESIWNMASDLYKNRDRKEQAWNSVASALHLEMTECKCKWSFLRVSYRVNKSTLS